MGMTTDVSTIDSTPAYTGEDFERIATVKDSTHTQPERQYDRDLIRIERENTPTERVILPCLLEAFVRLDKFELLPPDWDSYDAVAISHKAIDVARKLLYDAQDDLYLLLEQSGEEDMLKPIAVVPLSDGGVQLEWNGSAAEIEVEISPDGQPAFLLIQSRGAEKTYSENGRATASEIMVRLAHVLRLRP